MVKLIAREQYPSIRRWLKEPEVLAIDGARQTGKTTLLLRLKEELAKEKAVYVNFEDMEQLAAFSRAPKEFVSLQLAPAGKTYFLFDEFQYVEKAGKILKILYDQLPQAKFIISGSSSLKIREIASFLVGRIIFFTLYPLSFAEFLSFKEPTLFRLWQGFHLALINFLQGEKIKLPAFLFQPSLEKCLEEYLLFGGYPAVATSSADLKTERLKSLIETYIERDIIRFLKIDNFLEFRDTAKVLSLQIGNLVNYSSLTSDLRLSLPMVKKFLAVLEKTFVIKLLSPFFSNKITEIKKAPKNYFLDLGLRNALINDFRLLDLRQDKGALVENFVWQNLFYRQPTSDLAFWRTKQGAEVDFILRKANQIIPLEVKYQEGEKRRVSRSLTGFLEIYQPSRAVILTKNQAGLTAFRKTKILYLPVYFV